MRQLAVFACASLQVWCNWWVAMRNATLPLKSTASTTADALDGGTGDLRPEPRRL
jgi:hypothetical protein